MDISILLLTFAIVMLANYREAAHLLWHILPQKD